MLIKANRANNG